MATKRYLVTFWEGWHTGEMPLQVKKIPWGANVLTDELWVKMIRIPDFPRQTTRF